MLDTSAVVALANNERGRPLVMNTLRRQRAALCAVNLGELYALEAQGRLLPDWRSRLGIFAVAIHPFEEKHARASGETWPACRQLAGGIGDRAALSLALMLRWPVMSTDDWQTAAARLGVELIPVPR